ncbi:uncharacterized protein LOC103317241 isoform X2 [Nasonia vitripennis]|uniref:Uncharacterized protein n=1 Tax=Nasonia vitripennis TaxID=7425 RepID=A0A7M7IUV4_NASVI|nr:uncharacterized protein LOC103317241 isoform X2 [Nasonia vitripennis]
MFLNIEVNEQIKFELSATENSLLEDSLKEEELQGLETTEEVEANDEDTIDVEYVEHQTTPDGEPACKKQRISTAVNDLDLKALLEDHALGPSILRVYEAKKELCSASQSYLVEIITLHFLRDNNLRLTDHDFKVLADKILELFPEECLQTYYVGSVKKNESRRNKHERSKGKLVDKYRNRRTYILQSHKLSSQCQSTAKRVPVTNNLDVQSALESKEWLVINREKREVLKHWEFTFNLRQTDAKNQEYQTVADIYKNWPILEESYGFELIEKDFLQTYLNPFENICKRWNDVFSHAAAILKDKLTKDDRLILDSLEELDCESMTDYDTLIQVKLLNSFVAPKATKISYKKSGKKSLWKPSKAEAEEGIIIHVKIPGDIENEVNKKRNKMSNMKLSLQPFIILVGVNLKRIDQFFVRVDTVTYELPSLAKAIDILFKLYIFFNISYPVECENLFYFIQWAVYDIITESDVKIPSVCTLVHKVKKRLVEAAKN